MYVTVSYRERREREREIERERERERGGEGTVVEIRTEIDHHAMIYFLELAV